MSEMKMVSPATPQKAPSESGNDDAASSADNRISTLKGEHQASLHEPSPASTYGGTAIDVSVPATPQEGGSIVRRSANRQGLAPLSSTMKDDNDSPSVEHVTPSAGHIPSPHPIHDLRRPAASNRQSRRVRTTSEVRVDPTVGSIAQSGTTGSSSPKTLRAQRYYRARRNTNNTSTNSSPAGGRALVMNSSGNQPGTPSRSFVHGRATGSDDPFMSPSRLTPSRLTPRRSAAELPPNWRAAQATPSRRSASREPEATGPSPYPSGSPTTDTNAELEEPISAENAQAKFLPSACVFVANLLQTSTDEELEHSVSAVFSEFGKCWVKIRRDNRQMPFAFVQYENDDNARRAITEGRGRIIDGRRVRTERARVNRVLYISNLNGRAVSIMQAREIMEPYGELESITYPTETEMALYRLPRGCFVKYVYFQDAKDAQLFLRNDPNFQVEVPPIPQTAVVTVPRMETDPFAIHISGLEPEATTEDELIRYFGKYGRVVSASVHVKASRGGPGWVCYAFVRFARQEDAAKAIDTEHNNFWRGRKIQVRVRELVDPVARAALRLAHMRSVQNIGESSTVTSPGQYRRMGHEHTDGLSPIQSPSMTNNLNGALVAMPMTPEGARSVYPHQYPLYGTMMDPHYWNFGTQYPMGLPQKYTGSHAQHGTEDESASSLSPNTPAIAQGLYHHHTWYPQYSPEQAQMIPVPANPAGQHGHTVPYQLYSPPTMGHFAYPTALPYGAYHAPGFAYQNPDNSQAQHAIQQASPAYQCDQDRRPGNSPSNTASRFEEQPPASQ